MNEIIKAILMILAIVGMLFFTLFLITNMPLWSEKSSYGESSLDFCEKRVGTYQKNLFESPTCFIGDQKYSVYYDRNKESWSLAK